MVLLEQMFSPVVKLMLMFAHNRKYERDNICNNLTTRLQWERKSSEQAWLLFLF